VSTVKNWHELLKGGSGFLEVGAAEAQAEGRRPPVSCRGLPAIEVFNTPTNIHTSIGGFSRARDRWGIMCFCNSLSAVVIRGLCLRLGHRQLCGCLHMQHHVYE
jgi:hypothetical protein